MRDLDLLDLRGNHRRGENQSLLRRRRTGMGLWQTTVDAVALVARASEGKA